MPHPLLFRAACRTIVLLLFGLITVPQADAQEATGEDNYPTRDELPPGVVLVVHLVSKTHVKPTTGVVISNDGRVAVPASFVSAGDEIVVLEGGGSLARNGRRARTVQRSAASGLAILQVDGLQQKSITLARVPGTNNSRLRFGAFPPADLLASGSGPMWLPLTLEANKEAGIYGVSPKTRLPNVTGALFNRCDQWVGYTLADGVPSLKSELPPVVLFSPELERILASLDVIVRSDSCDLKASVLKRPGPGDESLDPLVQDTIEVTPPEIPAPAPEAPVELPEVTDAEDQQISPVETGTVPPTAEETNAVSWLIATLLAVIAAAFLVFRHRNNEMKHGKRSADEPDTIVLAKRVGNEETPGPEDLAGSGPLPPGSNAWLCLAGHLGDGKKARFTLPVNRNDFSITIGRRDCDVLIDDPSISREHAVISGSGGEFRFMDLGAKNGSFVGTMPSLQSEIVIIAPGCELILGGCLFQFTLLSDTESV